MGRRRQNMCPACYPDGHWSSPIGDSTNVAFDTGWHTRATNFDPFSGETPCAPHRPATFATLFRPPDASLTLAAAPAAAAETLRLMTGPQGGVWVPLGGRSRTCRKPPFRA